MQNRCFLLGLIVLIIMSCVKEQQEVVDVLPDAPVFYATLESSGDPDTRVYADDQLRVRWDAGDHISIFNKGTANQEYVFQGETGDNSGAFTKASGGSSATSSGLDLIYAVYPYQETTTMTDDGEITLTLPATQSYRENSFGLGANTMISVTEDNELHFKNLCGYFAVKLYGDNVSVSSISLKGNNNECLAGKATVVASADGFPTLQFDSADAVKELTLNLDTPVKIGSSSETATSFWFVIPPMTFENGITLRVDDDHNGFFESSSSNSLEIKRNTLKKSGAVRVEIEISQPNNVIYYTSSDGQIVTPYDSKAFGYNSIISNQYIDGQGIIKFASDVKFVGSKAFYGCTKLTSIRIPKSVIRIESVAFYGCSSLVSTNIPSGVTSIGSSAFYGCSSLASANIPSGVTSIGDSAFRDCFSLTDVIIPSTVTSIGNSTFNGCKSIISFSVDPANTVYDSRDNSNAIISSSSNTLLYGCMNTYIPSDVTSIGSSAFYGCSGLSNINIPSGVTSIGSSAFYGCSGLSNIDIPSGVTSIGPSAFRGCSSMTSINIPEGVTSIRRGTFWDCSSLVYVNIPSSVTSIGSYAFKECSSLISIHIPSNLTNIESEAFYHCGKLASIIVAPNNTVYDSREDCNAIIHTETNTLLYGSNDSHIPSSVTSVESNAFYGCSSLSSIRIPENVTSIGANAFKGCSGLTGITVLSLDPPTGGSGMFDSTNNAPIYVSVESVNKYKGAQFWSGYDFRIKAFPEHDNIITYASSDGKVVTPDSYFWVFDAYIISNEYKDGQGIITFDRSVSKIGGFGGPTLTSISFPDSVLSIEEYAFRNCSSLKSICFSGKETSIGYGAFDGCSSLTSINIPSSVTSIGSLAFTKCSSLTSIDIPESVTSIGTGAFSGCSSLSNIVIPSGVTSIGISTFYGCSSLASINIPEGVTSIGGSAFMNCSSLTSINIPGSVTSIGDQAFYRCSSLVNANIPEGVTSIERYTFFECSKLTCISIPESVTSIEFQAFAGCSSLSSIIIPKTVTILGDGAFNGCSGLTSIIIPEGLTSIGENAFSRCSGLTGIIIPENVTSIGSSAFSSCSSLTSIIVKPGTPPTGGVYMFDRTNYAPIYVPAGSLNAYKTAEYWSNYSDRIKAISQ